MSENAEASIPQVSLANPDWAASIEAIASNRDKKRFAILFEYFAPRLKSYFVRSGLDNATSEELAQEVLLSVWRKAGLFNPARASASTWIFTIARNLRIDIARRHVCSLNESEFADTLPELPPDKVLEVAEREVLVRAAVGALPFDQIAVIRLHFFNDCSHGEIAQLLKIPLGTVKTRVRLAMSKLRALVGHLQ
jgi:RNA polymerase sigma-70 factor (ECF subfamily)